MDGPALGMSLRVVSLFSSLTSQPVYQPYQIAQRVERRMFRTPPVHQVTAPWPATQKPQGATRDETGASRPREFLTPSVADEEGRGGRNVETVAS